MWCGAWSAADAGSAAIPIKAPAATAAAVRRRAVQETETDTDTGSPCWYEHPPGAEPGRAERCAVCGGGRAGRAPTLCPVCNDMRAVRALCYRLTIFL
nr:hypothetical protein StreXyl84_34960 [Streptomyces sp. Xyl84]